MEQTAIDPVPKRLDFVPIDANKADHLNDGSNSRLGKQLISVILHHDWHSAASLRPGVLTGNAVEIDRRSLQLTMAHVCGDFVPFDLTAGHFSTTGVAQGVRMAKLQQVTLKSSALASRPQLAGEGVCRERVAALIHKNVVSAGLASLR
jgi:hypothetical protein